MSREAGIKLQFCVDVPAAITHDRSNALLAAELAVEQLAAAADRTEWIPRE
jgi:hypothetical protein